MLRRSGPHWAPANFFRIRWGVKCRFYPLCVYPPPFVLPHPLSFPGLGGTVTWSTQKVLLQLTVLLCG